MAAQCQGEPRGLGSGRPVPWDTCPPRQEKEELCPQLCRAQEQLSLSSFSYSNELHVQVLSLYSADQRDLAWEPAGSVHLIPSKGWEGKQCTKAETPTNCIAEMFNPKRCIFSQETVTHDLIFPGYKTSKWFIWSVKKKVLPFFILR